MAVTAWLIDKSAYVALRQANSATRELWRERINRGLVRVSNVTRLEIGYSVRNRSEHVAEMTSPPLSLMPIEYLTPRAEERAIEVQGILASQGQHRAPSVADLLIAAIAEQADLIVLERDKDFRLIAEVTGQPIESID